MPTLTAEERVGTTLDGTYDILRIVDRGGMGVLFEAKHRWTARKVAIKLLHPVLDGDSSRVTRFITEARAAAMLGHPNVVDVLDMGEDSGAPYLVMEFLDGCSLERLLKDRGQLSASETLALLLPIIGAMACVHDAGVIHRDLKPSNIFVSRERANLAPKLLDFGIAKVLEATGITTDGVALGTPQYMAPEQASGGPIGPASDVWSMGVILFRCISGSLPFPGRDLASVLSAILHEPPRRLVTLDPSAPRRLSAAIERALCRDPAARYADMRSFAHALMVSAAADGVEVPAEPDSLGLPDWAAWLREIQSGGETTAGSTIPFALERAPRRPGRRRALLGASAVVLAGVLLVLFTRRGTEEPSIASSSAAPAPLPVLESPSASAQAPSMLAAAAASESIPAPSTKPLVPVVEPPPKVSKKSPARAPTLARTPTAPSVSATTRPERDELPQLRTEW